jgi:hypothetical protein
MAAKKSKSAAPESVDSVSVAVEETQSVAPAADDVASKFVGQWSRLVSTTNWAKGRIICEWREALELAGATVTEYSDEAWAQLVGGVTSQHVGRLRRVFQRFGPVFDQYEGLYWSHFQAGLDWEDAEMWLEGAILNGWSVSQMRGKRWETHGNAGDPPADEAIAPFDEDAALLPDGEAASAAGDPANSSTTSIDADEEGEEAESDADESDEESSSSSSESSDYESPASPAKSRSRLNVEVGDLPDDIADAFEAFKLAIIAQRRLGWGETTPEAVIECLDALRALALAPSDD